MNNIYLIVIFIDKGIKHQRAKTKKIPRTGLNQNISAFAPAGSAHSLVNSLTASAKG